MKKKIISIVIAVALIASALTAVMVSASAKVVDGRYEPSTTDTYRYYFYMPNDWENSYTQSTVAGVYWWAGTDACSAFEGYYPDIPAWPGYVAQYEGSYADGSIYYIDCPTDVATIIWNNYVNGGTFDKETGEYQFSKEQYTSAVQTVDISQLDDPDVSCNWDLYPDGLDSFDDMIYVLDYSKTQENALNGKLTYVGDWYYYYGYGKYGVQPTLEEAEAAGAVMNTAYQPPKGNTEPTTPYEPVTTTPIEPITRPSDYEYPVTDGKTINFDVWSTGWNENAIKYVYCHIYRYSGDDGKTYPSWQTKAERCSYDRSTGIATYDLQTGIDKGADGLETIDNTNKWVIMFSCNTGAETYGLLFNSDCFGDTVVADPNTIYENPFDDAKYSIEIGYNKNKQLTSPKCITSTGKVQGESYADGTTDVTILGDYLALYATDDRRVNKEIVSKLANELGIEASSTLSYVENKINNDAYYDDNPHLKKYAIDRVKSVIDSIPEAILGDVNGDGKIGIDDATDIQKYMAEMLDFTDKQKELADVNKDGKVGVDDVTLIQKHMAGLAVIE